MCTCRLNINELQGGPKCIGRCIIKYEEELSVTLYYVRFIMRFIYVRGMT